MSCPKKWKVKTKPPNARIVEVPCGTCSYCRKMRSLEWSARISHELAINPYSGFITLTYDEDNVRWKGLYMTLCKDDLQKYHKKLRKAGLRYKYYQVGEYGEKYDRPHYHVIMLGAGVKDKALLEEKWEYGIIDVGLVEPKSISYVVSYVRKSPRERNIYYGKREEPFMTCSQGIGLEYAERNVEAIRDQESVKVNGGTISIPRYYLKKGAIEKKQEHEMLIKRQQEMYQEFIESGMEFSMWCKKRNAEEWQSVKNIDALKNLFGGGKL